LAGHITADLQFWRREGPLLARKAARCFEVRVDRRGTPTLTWR
jgi:hypothetical protein